MATPIERAQSASSIYEFLTNAAQVYGDAVAFTCGPMRLSFERMAELGDALAAYLHSVGVSKGDRVALMTPNLLAFPIATFGIQKLGALQVNVNPLYTATELEHQLNDAGVETLIVFSGTSAAFASVREQTNVKRVIVIHVGDGSDMDIPSPPPDEALGDYVSFADALQLGADLDCAPAKIARSELALLQYTGGTTGPSKGAMLSHANVLSNIAQAYAHDPNIFVDGQEVVVTAIPMYHIFALTVNFMMYFGCGGKNVLITNPRDMNAFTASIKASRFTVMTGVNSLFAGLTMHPEFPETDFSGVKACINGGTAALAATSDKWQSITGIPLIQGYGLSETSPILTLAMSGAKTFTGHIGSAIPGTDIKLLDDKDQEVPLGERGELVAKGPQVTAGYYQREDATKEAFTADGFFRTGDIAIAEQDGVYRIVDRKKDMVIVSGFNVYPNDVEQVAATCDGVVECACLGVPDAKTGEAVKLFVVKAEGSAVTAEDIIAHCREQMTAYKVPKQIEFIDEVPKSAVGKMLRRVLRVSN